jgi:hypothetical protein
MLFGHDSVSTLSAGSKQGVRGKRASAAHPTRPPKEAIIFILLVITAKCCRLRWRLGPLCLEQLKVLVNLSKEICKRAPSARLH